MTGFDEITEDRSTGRKIGADLLVATDETALEAASRAVRYIFMKLRG